MGMTITVYSKPACVQCTATTRALDMRGLDYRVIDLTQDADAMNDVTEMGYRQVPVVGLLFVCDGQYRAACCSLGR